MSIVTIDIVTAVTILRSVSQGHRKNTKIKKWELVKLTSFCTAKETINKTGKRPKQTFFQIRHTYGHQRAVWNFLPKLKIELLHDLPVPLWVFIQMKEDRKKTLTQKVICTLIFLATLFIIAKTWNYLSIPDA